MKYFSLLVLATAILGCSSSSHNPLVGKWLSNCHEFIGAESVSGGTVYAVSEYTFLESTYVDNVISYTDINCTANPVAETFTGSYTAGSTVTASDGATATRMTISPSVPDRPDLAITLEAVYRISGVDLNFGRYSENETPSVDYRVTYLKQ